MGDSLLKWLGHDKPAAVRVSHKVWRKQLVDRTRHVQLKLGADRARQRTEMLMLDGTDIVRVVEAAGARHEVAGAGPEAETSLEAREVEDLGDGSEWEDWSMGDWVAGTGVDMEEAGAVAGAGGESGVRSPWLELRMTPVAHKGMVVLERPLLMSPGE